MIGVVVGNLLVLVIENPLQGARRRATRPSGQDKSLAPACGSALRLVIGVLGVLTVLACSAHEVIRVVDGDSLIVSLKQERIRVRLKEIDAPELKQSFGKRSRESLTAMCANKAARVLWTEKDRNGRTLGRVWCSGIDANAEQVRRGMAWVFDRYVKDRNLYPLQDTARAARRGLWAEATPLPPWEWRRARGTLEYRAP
jgi:endonuclease YncB( thermonuclease family)